LGLQYAGVLRIALVRFGQNRRNGNNIIGAITAGRWKRVGKMTAAQ